MKRRKPYARHDRRIVLWTIGGALLLLLAIWKSPRIHADDPAVIMMACFVLTVIAWASIMSIQQYFRK